MTKKGTMVVASFSKSERKATGSHYTPILLAQFVAKQMKNICNTPAPRVLDPACGDGELLKAFVTEFPMAQIMGYDLDTAAINEARAHIDGVFERRDFLSIALNHRGDLFDSPKFDAVIANPPYVRTQVLGAKRAQNIAKTFELNGRVDLYHAFLDGIASVLVPAGVAGVIVSNRFMTTKSGSTIRSRIMDQFDIIHIWDLGDTKLFEAAVLPAVLLLQKKRGKKSRVPRFSSIYSTAEIATRKAAHPIEALETSGIVRVNESIYRVQHGTLNCNGVWRIATKSGDTWLNTVSSRAYCTFGDVGKIHVGVKTTADKVFVRKEWPEPKPELLLPLLTHHSARRYRSLPHDREILYTHQDRGGKKIAVDLDLYPISKAYLETQKETLSARTYIIEAGRNWFEIWVPQQPSLLRRPKLYFPDISEKPVFAMSLGGEIIQGDCYWFAADQTGKEDLLWLALAVANSCFIEEFYDRAFHNKLYAGRRRFLSQYVEKFPIPDPFTPLSREIIRMVKLIYKLTPSIEADSLAEDLEYKICQAFGVTEKVAR